MKSQKKLSLKILFVIICTSLVFSAVILCLFMASEREAKREQLKALLTTQATQMTNSVNQALTHVYAMQALVLGYGGENIDLAKMGPFLVREDYSGYIRNVLIAPNGVVSQVYPLSGNENVIGLDLYSRKNASFAAALDAQKSGRLVVTGPYNLVQGGQAISGRVLVRIPQADGNTIDWGIVSVTLAFPEVMESTATATLEKKGYAYQVFRRNAHTGEYGEVLNHGFQEGQRYESLSFSIQSMEFRIQAYPLAGWNDIQTLLKVFFGFFIGFVAVAFAVQYLVVRQMALREKASKDAMTGLLNRATGKYKINQALKDKRFSNGAFMLLDIDHFKSVNDVLGHQVGDRLLIESAKIFQAIFRSNDVVCRLGGDEFVIYMDCPNGYDFLKNKVQQLQNAMRRKVQSNGQTVEISCSIGIVTAPEHGRLFDALYSNADKALYSSKEHGRDCATLYPDTLIHEK